MPAKSYLEDSFVLCTEGLPTAFLVMLSCRVWGFFWRCGLKMPGLLFLFGSRPPRFLERRERGVCGVANIRRGTSHEQRIMWGKRGRQQPLVRPGGCLHSPGSKITLLGLVLFCSSVFWPSCLHQATSMPFPCFSLSMESV